MLEWYPGKDEKARIDAELTCAGICPKGIEMFYSLYGQCSSLDAHDWMFRSCFMKDGQVTDECVIMQLGDGYTKYGKGRKSAEAAIRRYFGLFARTAMFDRIVLLTSSLSTGDGECESSLLNFAEKHCPEAIISKRIKHEISVDSLKKIDGAKDLHLYRNKRAAHHDYGLDTDKIRLLYGTIEECIDRIFRAMNVVYPMPPRVDWKKREDVVGQNWNPNHSSFEWTTDPGEPFIVQSLKELAIRRRWENLQLLNPYVEDPKVALMRDEILAEIEKIRAS